MKYKYTFLFILLLSTFVVLAEPLKYLESEYSDSKYRFACGEYVVTNRDGYIYKYIRKDNKEMLKYVEFKKVLIYMAIYCSDKTSVENFVGLMQRYK